MLMVGDRIKSIAYALLHKYKSKHSNSVYDHFKRPLSIVFKKVFKKVNVK